MKKLFKKALASLLAVAIAVSSLIFGVSAAELSVTGTGYADKKLTVTVGTPVNLTVNTQADTITANSNKTAVATATVSNKTVTVSGVSQGAANIELKAGTDSLKIAVTVKEAPITTEATSLYSDPECTMVQDNSGVIVYVNGGRTKGENVIDYKNATLYFKENTLIKKYIATATTSDTVPELTEKGAFPDDSGIKEAKDMVKVAVDMKKRKVTISSGKKTSDDKTVTAWIYGLSQGGQVVTRAGVKVTVKGAASSINVYDAPVTDNSVPVKSVVIAPNTTDNVIYFKGIIKDASKDKPNTMTDNDYTIEADPKATAVTLGVVNQYSGYFTVLAGSIAPDAKGKVKPITAKFKITNVQSGKSVTIPIIIDNDVKSVSSSINDLYAKKIDEKGDVAKIDVAATRHDSNVPSTNKISGIVLNGPVKFDEKGKMTTQKSKLCSVKIQDAAEGYRARVIWSGAKEEVANSAEEMQIIYLVTTNSAKKTTYFEVGKISRDGMIYASNPST